MEEAAAIVVLWSLGSMNSVWVKHEASQAIAKRIYAPVRIEVMEIDSPYNRIQATDMFNWTGDVHSPGFQNLLIRLKELMPEPVPLSRKVAGFIRKEIIAITLFLITTAALYLLVSQSSILKGQLLKQDSLLSNVQKTDTLLNKTKDSLDVQFKRVREVNKLINKNLTETSQKMEAQFEQAQVATNNIKTSTATTIKKLGAAINALSGLESSQKQVLNNIRRNLYPIDANKMRIEYQAYWDVTNENILKYTDRVLQFAKQQIPVKGITATSITGPNNEYLSSDYAFAEQKVKIRYTVSASNEVKVGSVFIQDNSPLMPDCNDFYENMVSQVTCEQRLYLTFSKNYDPKKSYTNQQLLRFITFTDSKQNSCAQKNRHTDEPASGNSTVEVYLQFDKNTDKLTAFRVTYNTTKIIADVNTGELISVIDLLDADFSLEGGVAGTDIYPIQINDVIIATGGETLGGIRFGNGGNLQSVKTKEFKAVYKLDKECFNKNIFKQ